MAQVTLPFLFAPSIVPYLGLFPVANGPDNGDGTAFFLFPGAETGHEYYAVGKFDQNFSDLTHFSASFQWDTGALVQPDLYNQKFLGFPFESLQLHDVSATQFYTGHCEYGAYRREPYLRRGFAGRFCNLASRHRQKLGFFGQTCQWGVLTAGNLSTAGGLGASGSDNFHFTSYQASDDISIIHGRQHAAIWVLFDRMMTILIRLIFRGRMGLQFGTRSFDQQSRGFYVGLSRNKRGARLAQVMFSEATLKMPFAFGKT